MFRKELSFFLAHSMKICLPSETPVVEELERIEQPGVIEQVVEPTDCCAGMVIVPKTIYWIRICMDLIKLNIFYPQWS